MATLEELIRQYENDPEIRKEIDKILEDGIITPREFLTFAAKHDVKVTLAELPDMVKEAKKYVSGVFETHEHENKQFHTDDNCIGCGECASCCPMGAISIVEEKPVWGGGCVHCMSCMDQCPAGAISYGFVHP